MQLMAAIFYPFVGLINQAKTRSHSQANKLYDNPRKVLKFTYWHPKSLRWQNHPIFQELQVNCWVEQRDWKSHRRAVKGKHLRRSGFLVGVGLARSPRGLCRLRSRRRPPGGATVCCRQRRRKEAAATATTQHKATATSSSFPGILR